MSEWEDAGAPERAIDPCRNAGFRRPMSDRLKALALSSDSVHSLVHYAERLAVAPRTLQRRLRAEGTTYRLLLSEIRVELAVRALDRGASVSAAADATGFADEASFYRAFKRWTGSTPRSFHARAVGERSAEVRCRYPPEILK